MWPLAGRAPEVHAPSLQTRCVASPPFPDPLVNVTKGRCAAVLFYGHQLAVLPAAGADAPEFADELEAGAEDGLGGGEAAAVANSYVVDLSLQGIREVIQRHCN